MELWGEVGIGNEKPQKSNWSRSAVVHTYYTTTNYNSRGSTQTCLNILI